MQRRRRLVKVAWVMLAAMVTAGALEWGARAASPMSMPAAMPADGFVAGMSAAMARMDAGMSVAYSGNADHDFAAMMIPHHQGAVDMAVLELQYGQNTTLKRLAQEIIVTQRQEIEVMQRAVAEMPRTKATGR